MAGGRWFESLMVGACTRSKRKAREAKRSKTAESAESVL
jgi:hypothetical protein